MAIFNLDIINIHFFIFSDLQYDAIIKKILCKVTLYICTYCEEKNFLILSEE